MSSELVQLVDRCLANDQHAIQSLIERFRGQVYRLCLRFMGQHQDAEDAVQETFTRVVRSLDRWNQSLEFEPWLMTIAANRCRTLLANRQKKPPHKSLFDCDVNDHRTEQTRDAAHLQEEISRLITELKPQWREAFLLFHQHHMSYQQIADELDCSLGTIKTWVHRARRQLVDRLQEREAV